VPAGGLRARRSGWSLEASGDGRPRRMAVAARKRAVQNPAYRPSGPSSCGPGCYSVTGTDEVVTRFRQKHCSADAGAPRGVMRWHVLSWSGAKSSPSNSSSSSESKGSFRRRAGRGMWSADAFSLEPSLAQLFCSQALIRNNFKNTERFATSITGDRAGRPKAVSLKSCVYRPFRMSGPARSATVAKPGQCHSQASDARSERTIHTGFSNRT